MDGIVEQMSKPAPKHVVEGVCQRLKEIEAIERDTGPLLADECRKFIYARDEITWLDVLVSAYYMNGGVMLREAVPAPFPSSSSLSSCSSSSYGESGGHHGEKSARSCIDRRCDDDGVESPNGPSNSPKHAHLPLSIPTQTGSSSSSSSSLVEELVGEENMEGMESMEAWIASIELEEKRMEKKEQEEKEEAMENVEAKREKKDRAKAKQ
jgi:hypothetical protein